jgi:hypothetical protein
MSDSSAKEVAQRGYSLALRRLAELKQTNVAEAMGISEPAVSKLKNEQLEQCVTLLAYLGIKCVPVSHRCMPQDAYQFLTSTHQRVMEQAPQLVWGEE